MTRGAWPFETRINEFVAILAAKDYEQLERRTKGVPRRPRKNAAIAVRTMSGLHVNIPDRMLAPPVDVQGKPVGSREDPPAAARTVIE
jgi:hypothetical protein